MAKTASKKAKKVKRTVSKQDLRTVGVPVAAGATITTMRGVTICNYGDTTIYIGFSNPTILVDTGEK